jgi:predicted TIM-barrel fold metal-dependent hydrolase
LPRKSLQKERKQKTLIIDNHAHIFPFLGENSEYEAEGIQLVYARKALSRLLVEPTHRKSDFKIMKEDGLWDSEKPGWDGMSNVNFRVGKFGRYEWTVNGVDYCKQLMPVGMQDMISPPEFIIAQMDHAGIDKAVLQRGHIYGKLENYYHKAIKKYPHRFIGLTQIDESKAYEDKQIAELHRAIDQLGLKGLYFEPGVLWMGKFGNFDDKVFAAFWEEVDSMSIPVYTQMVRLKFLDEMKRWEGILDKHTNITLVISMGLPEELALRRGGVHIPEVVKRLLTERNVYLDVAYPISMGLNFDYPYPEAQRIIRHLYERFGPSRLVWGSDMPNVERYCTYAQSLNYLRKYCDFLSEADKELILAKNVMAIFKMDR